MIDSWFKLEFKRCVKNLYNKFQEFSNQDNGLNLVKVSEIELSYGKRGIFKAKHANII